MSEWNLQLAVEKCSELTRTCNPSVHQLHAFALNAYGISTPLPCGERLAEYRNAEMFSFKQRLKASFELKSSLRTAEVFDYKSLSSFCSEIRKVELGEFELELCGDLIDKELFIFVLDLTEKKLKFGDEHASSTVYYENTIRFEPGQWEQLVDKATNEVVVGATIYYYP